MAKLSYGDLERFFRNDVSLLAHAAGLALRLRDTSVREPRRLGGVLIYFEKARSIGIADNRLPEWLGIESKYTSFARYREMTD